MTEIEKIRAEIQRCIEELDREADHIVWPDTFSPPLTTWASEEGVE